MPSETDFFITFSARGSGLGISCACCWNLLDSSVPSPLWIFVDRAGSRPVCMACMKHCTLLVEVLRSFYGKLNGPRSRNGTARGTPPESQSMAEFRAMECDVVCQYAQAIQSVEVYEPEPPDRRQGK